MKEYQFDQKLDGAPSTGLEDQPYVVKQAELHVSIYANRILRSDAYCACNSCKSSAFALIDWLFYPSQLETKTKVDLFNQLKCVAHEKIDNKRIVDGG